MCVVVSCWTQLANTVINELLLFTHRWAREWKKTPLRSTPPLPLPLSLVVAEMKARSRFYIIVGQIASTVRRWNYWISFWMSLNHEECSAILYPSVHEHGRWKHKDNTKVRESFFSLDDLLYVCVCADATCCSRAPYNKRHKLGMEWTIDVLSYENLSS